MLFVCSDGSVGLLVHHLGDHSIAVQHHWHGYKHVPSSGMDPFLNISPLIDFLVNIHSFLKATTKKVGNLTTSTFLWFLFLRFSESTGPQILCNIFLLFQILKLSLSPTRPLNSGRIIIREVQSRCVPHRSAVLLFVLHSLNSAPLYFVFCFHWST